jgi:hypothetical protein
LWNVPFNDVRAKGGVGRGMVWMKISHDNKERTSGVGIDKSVGSYFWDIGIRIYHHK